MENRADNRDAAELERLNAQLTDSLERCRRILADCQSKLAANTNQPENDAGSGLEAR
jgi:hypothetical protein